MWQYMQSNVNHFLCNRRLYKFSHMNVITRETVHKEWLEWFLYDMSITHVPVYLEFWIHNCRVRPSQTHLYGQMDKHTESLLGCDSCSHWFSLITQIAIPDCLFQISHALDLPEAYLFTWSVHFILETCVHCKPSIIIKSFFICSCRGVFVCGWFCVPWPWSWH